MKMSYSYPGNMLAMLNFHYVKDMKVINTGQLYFKITAGVM